MYIWAVQQEFGSGTNGLVGIRAKYLLHLQTCDIQQRKGVAAVAVSCEAAHRRVSSRKRGLDWLGDAGEYSNLWLGDCEQKHMLTQSTNNTIT